MKYINKISGRNALLFSMRFACAIIFMDFSAFLHAQDLPNSLPELKYHLSSPDWQPLNTPRENYLDAVEGMARVAQKFQSDDGAIIDPYLHREHQYSTPYFAFAVGTLISADRAKDLLPSGILAMEKSLTDFSYGLDSIPDKHGEFYIAALAGAMELYKEHISKEKYAQWRKKITTPLSQIWGGPDGRLNNWRTYAMKGEWIRASNGFIDKKEAVEFVEDNWKNATQYQRIGLTKWNLYEDWSSDPQSLAVEAVGRGNLTALAMSGYDGPSADQFKEIIRQGGMTSMLLMSPTGQCPPNGRTDDHVFNDVLYQLIFEVLAENAIIQRNPQLAGQYRRSAALAFQSIDRWKRTDGQWKGSFSITKNHYDMGDRIGYQPASQWGNYSGAMMYHLAEAYLSHKTNIREMPSPVEIGGYAIQTGARFSTFTANAGGMQVMINLRGATVPKYGDYWTPLGGVRFSKMNWDDRLGPSDGIRMNADNDPSLKAIGDSSDDIYPQTGLTFGPTWKYKDNWVRIADFASHYQGTVTTEFVHPLLVKFSVDYNYIDGFGGPNFKQEFIITPDGVMTYLTSPQDIALGVTVPLLAEDGRELQTDIADGIASTGYPDGGDTQNFIGLNQEVKVSQDGTGIKSSYGTLLPVKFQSEDEQQVIFIYPKSMNRPDARKVKESFELTDYGFSSLLGKVEGTIYIGNKAAGGFGDALDLNGDGKPEITFNVRCGFVAQLVNGKISAIETDRAVTAFLYGNPVHLNAYEPLEVR